MGLRDYRRNPVLWVLLVVVPIVFIVLAKAMTASESGVFSLVERGGSTVMQVFWLPDVHAGTMTPIAVSSLAALAGLFVGLDARGGDRRLTLAGFPFPPLLLAVRLTMIGFAAGLVTVSSLMIIATVFDARQWGVYGGGNLLMAVTYGLLGFSLGPSFGCVGGVFIAFLVPFSTSGSARVRCCAQNLRPGHTAYRDTGRCGCCSTAG